MTETQGMFSEICIKMVKCEIEIKYSAFKIKWTGEIKHVGKA